MEDYTLPRMLVTDRLDAGAPPHSGKWGFRSTGAIGTAWDYAAPGFGLALYEDSRLSALKGLRLRVLRPGEPDQEERLDFLALADGSFDADLRDGNDFHVMEAGICRALRNSKALPAAQQDAEAFCGAAGYWGY